MNTLLKDYFTFPSTQPLQKFNYGKNRIILRPLCVDLTPVELIGNEEEINLFIEDRFIGFISDQLQYMTPERVLTIAFKNNTPDAWTLRETANTIAILNGWLPAEILEVEINK